MKDLLKEQRVLPIKVKNGISTVIEWNGQRYVLEHSNQHRSGVRKPVKNMQYN